MATVQRAWQADKNAKKWKKRSSSSFDEPKDLTIPEYLNEAQKKCFKDFIEIIEFVKEAKGTP